MSFYFSEHGSKTKPSIIFLHGFMGSSNDWLPLIEDIKKDYYCIAIDLPGHGKTPGHICEDHRQLIVHLGEFIKGLTAKTFLVGYSMGGRIALELLQAFPELFKGSVIESANPGIRDYLERNKRLREDLELLQNIKTQDDLNDFLNNWYKNPIFGQLGHHKNFNLLLDKPIACVKEWKESQALMSIGTQPDLWSRLELLQSQITFVTGTQDSKYSHIGKELQQHALIKHVEIPEVGHNCHFEKPQEFLKILKETFS